MSAPERIVRALRDKPENKPAGVPLTRLKTGAKAVIVSLGEMSSHERNKLMALGVMPGAELNLMQRFPSYVISVGYTQLALDRETARLIRVTTE